MTGAAVEPAGLPGPGAAGDLDAVRVDLDPAVDGDRGPARARRAVREVLLRWRLQAMVDDVVLAVSELVTNAMRHGRPPVFLVLRRRARDVRLDVHDADPAAPAAAAALAGESSESGRGLPIVAALADEVGCEQVPQDGKIMFASFAAPGA